MPQSVGAPLGLRRLAADLGLTTGLESLGLPEEALGRTVDSAILRRVWHRVQPGE